MRNARTWLAVFCLLLLPTLAAAQTWNAEQQEVWKLEEQQWQMSKDKDISWIDKMVHPNISYWDVDQPGPQNKASLQRWNRFSNANSTVLEQELFPISMTITGNIAVVQYRYSVARENYKKERETALDGTRMSSSRRAAAGCSSPGRAVTTRRSEWSELETLIALTDGHGIRRRDDAPVPCRGGLLCGRTCVCGVQPPMKRLIRFWAPGSPFCSQGIMRTGDLGGTDSQLLLR